MKMQLNESSIAIHRWLALSKLLMFTYPKWIDDSIVNLPKFRPGWNAMMDSSGKIFHYIFIGEGQGRSSIDQPLVDESEIHAIHNEANSKILLDLHTFWTSKLKAQDSLDTQTKIVISEVYNNINRFWHMSSDEAFKLAVQPMQKVEEEFTLQFVNLYEMRVTGPRAWLTVKEAQKTVSEYLSFQIPGFVAALRLVSIHILHCKALEGWSTRNRVFEYLEKNVDHLHRRTFILLDQSCVNATLESAGQMIYLAWLYGTAAIILNGIKEFAEKNPEEFFSGVLPDLKGVHTGRKSKAIDELIVHRALPAFDSPALGIALEGMTEAEKEILHQYHGKPFIYPQLKGRFPLPQLHQSSQLELFDLVNRCNDQLGAIDVIDSVTEGDNQPVNIESLEVFTVQQMGRNFMHLILQKFEERISGNSDGD